VDRFNQVLATLVADYEPASLHHSGGPR
jgi:hypothetical protein